MDVYVLPSQDFGMLDGPCKMAKNQRRAVAQNVLACSLFMDAYLAGSKISTFAENQSSSTLTVPEIPKTVHSKPWVEPLCPVCQELFFHLDHVRNPEITSETVQTQLGQEASSSPWRSPIRRT